MKAGKPVRFDVRLTNKGRKPAYLTHRGVVLSCTKLVFQPGPTAPDHQIASSGIDCCPPVSDVLPRGESRTYAFTWKPPHHARGAGALEIGLPNSPLEMPAISPQPVFVKAAAPRTR